jgi:hypothetical protein
MLRELRQNYVAPWHVGNHLKPATKRLDDATQRPDLHIGLLLHFREARLRNAEFLREILLSLAGKLAQLRKKHFGL